MCDLIYQFVSPSPIRFMFERCVSNSILLVKYMKVNGLFAFVKKRSEILRSKHNVKVIGPLHRHLLITH